MKQFVRALLLGITLMGLPSAAIAQGAQQRQIQVSGEAKIEVRPDLARVTIGVSNEGADAVATMNANAVAATKIIETAKKAGVTPEDIVTANLSLQPRFRDRRNPDGSSTNERSGYSARNTVTVTIRDIAKVGDFTRQFLDGGANTIDGVTFGLTKPETHLDTLRVAALKDARRKAEMLAGAADARLGKVLTIVHPPREGGRHETVAAYAGKARMAADVPMESGAISLSAEVDAVWALE